MHTSKLTVTSLIQVKPVHLGDYLLAMRSNGYTVVGVEQTAHSKIITSYQFPYKTVLLLGYENNPS